MIIDKTNPSLVDKIYIHDCIIDDLYFNRVNKVLTLVIKENNQIEKINSLKFINVIGFEMSACDFWCSSPHVFDFEYVKNENATIIPRMFDRAKSENESLAKLKKPDDYIEVIITFTSGDTLIIACETIIVNQ